MLRLVQRFVCLLLIAAVGVTVGFSQTATSRDNTDVLLSSGSNTTPTGPLRVTSYRLEKRQLGGSPVTPRDGGPPLDYAFRLTIKTDGTVPIAGAAIWIGDKKIAASPHGLNGYAVMLYSRTLPDNATLGLSEVSDNSLAGRSILPDTLSVPLEFATSPEEIEAQKPTVRLKRYEGGGFVYLYVEEPLRRCSIGGSLFFIVVGDKQLQTDCSDDAYLASIPGEIYDSLNTGDEIVLMFGQDRSSTPVAAGYLDKSAVEIETIQATQPPE